MEREYIMDKVRTKRIGSSLEGGQFVEIVSLTAHYDATDVEAMIGTRKEGYETRKEQPPTDVG